MGISQQQALDCFRSDDLIGIGMEADAIRAGLHPDGIVTYAVDRTFEVNRDKNLLLREIESAVAEGVTAIRLVGMGTGLADLENLLPALHTRFPSLRVQALIARDIPDMAASAGLSENEVLIRLRSAGLDAIGGEFSSTSPERWLQVHAAAHRAGLRSRASLTFGGAIESEALVAQMMSLRALQDETAGFTGISLSGYMPSGERAEFERPTAVEYLRTLAIARMVLDNFDNIESSGVDEGLKVMQMALRFGANDGGTISSSGGPSPTSFTEADLRRVIRDAGFAPVERDSLYLTMFLNH